MLTCEHASNRLPAALKKFVPADVQTSHRAYDIGALMVFRKLVKFAKPEFYSEGKFSRLFVDLNRTITNKSAFSEYYGKLEASDKAVKCSTNTDKKKRAQATRCGHRPPGHTQLYARTQRQSPQRRHRHSLRPHTPAGAHLRERNQGRNQAAVPAHECAFQLPVQGHFRRANHHFAQEIRPPLCRYRNRDKPEILHLKLRAHRPGQAFFLHSEYA